MSLSQVRLMLEPPVRKTYPICNPIAPAELIEQTLRGESEAALAMVRDSFGEQSEMAMALTRQYVGVRFCGGTGGA